MSFLNHVPHATKCDNNATISKLLILATGLHFIQFHPKVIHKKKCSCKCDIATPHQIFK